VVIGGGVAGVATAWLVDGVHDVVLLEAESEFGGHARTIDVSVDGRRVPVDTGAQFFGPKSQPNYWKLLTQVLQVPTIKTPMNVTVCTGAGDPVLVSPDTNRLWPLANPRYWAALQAMAALTDRGRTLLASGDRTTTAEQFIRSLPVLPSVRDNLLFPLATAVTGFSVAQAREMSAFSIAAFVVRELGDGLLAPFDYSNCADGLRAVVAALMQGLGTVTALSSSPVTALSREDGRYRVTDAAGQVHVADHVVFALPPYAAAPLVDQLPGGATIASTYRRFTYIPVRIAIHRDPTYMPARRRDWSGFNVLSDGPSEEGSMWFGGYRGVDVFKSWVTHRREQPRDVVATFDYRHAHETPDFARAQTDLAAVQGDSNLWFAGTHTVDVASQESALMSAVAVAKRLAPESKNLARLGV
jgi:uncharacterized protein